MSVMNKEEPVTFLGEELVLKGKIWHGTDGLAVDDCGLDPGRYRAMWNGRCESGRTPQEASDKLEKGLLNQLDMLSKRLDVKGHTYNCLGCGHARSSHKTVGEGGCTECLCVVHMVDGICWAIQYGSKWVKFSRDGNDGFYPCTNLGDASVFSDSRIAENHVKRYHPQGGGPWVVRELLVTPLEKEDQE